MEIRLACSNAHDLSGIINILKEQLYYPMSGLRQYMKDAYNIPNVRLKQDICSYNTIMLEVLPIQPDSIPVKRRPKRSEEQNMNKLATWINDFLMDLENFRTDCVALKLIAELKITISLERETRNMQEAHVTQMPIRRNRMPTRRVQWSNMISRSWSTLPTIWELFSDEDSITTEDTEEGIFNVMHIAVKKKNIHVLRLLLYANCWSFLRGGTVTNSTSRTGASQLSRYYGYTPRRLAESFNDNCYECVSLYDEIEGEWESLTLLAKACVSRDVKLVKALIEGTPDCLVRDQSCILYACASGSTDVVEYLLRKGCSIDIQNNRDETVFHLAALCGHSNILNLVTKSRENISIETRDTVNNCTALEYCTMTGDLNSLKILQRAGWGLCSSLSLAVKYQNAECITYLLSQPQCDVNTGADSDGLFAVHHAVIHNDVNLLIELMDQGGIVASVDRLNRNVLHLAAEHKSYDVLDFLATNHREDVQSMTDHQQWYTANVERVVGRCADDHRCGLHILDLNRLKTKTFQENKKAGNIDVANYGTVIASEYGVTLSSRMTEMCRAYQNQTIVQRKPDMTPLHVAVLAEDCLMTEQLLSYGSAVETPDRFGATVAHIAAMNGDIPMLKILEENNIGFDVLTKSGKSVLDVAIDNNQILAADQIRPNTQDFLAQEFSRKIAQPIRKRMDIITKMGQQCADKGNPTSSKLKESLKTTCSKIHEDIKKMLVDLGSGPVVSESNAHDAVRSTDSTSVSD